MTDTTATTQFPSPFEFNFRHPIPLLELRMWKLSGHIRSKPNWWTKVQDPELTAKWREEMVQQDAAIVDRFWGGPKRLEWDLSTTGERQWPRSKITDAQLDYIFDQLRYEATRYDAATGIFATAVPKVYESRSLITATLKAPLVDGVSVLESVPDEDKDWHPGSNKQVLDLVHPSMYCLRIGQSYVRPPDDTLGPTSGPVKAITVEEYMRQRPDMDRFRTPGLDYVISPKFQWLPTNFKISEDGDAKALSYINNLHPTHHRALYPAISSILARFIPLFENVLTDAINPEPQTAVRPIPDGWYRHTYSTDASVPRPYDEPDANDSVFRDWPWDGKWPYVPEPIPFEPPSTEGRTTVSLRGRTLQVIAKLANIVLTPDNPAYPGGSWHVEGMANEAIVATGLYYYACENITESRLDFRAAVGSEENGVYLDYEQSDDTGYMTVYGLQRDSLLNQRVGGIIAEEDKCVAFPNIYQHRVDAFELADPTKPGHRKILCFFLVDPFTKILSTSDVPPQQADWTTEALGGAQTLQQLPQELFDIVVDYARDDKVSRKEAEDVREQLMDERSTFVVEHNKELFEVEFYMCEH